ncbi:MAG: 50S ribosomal protein L11 [Gemmatimonadales bacterium]
MAKRLDKQLKVLAPGGKATPAPPLGPALGAAGVNPGQFVQQFNERTKDLKGKIVAVLIRVYHDRSFDFEVKSSPASVLIKEAAGVEKGSASPAAQKVGTIKREQLRSIAQEKVKDLNAPNLDAAMKIIAGTARSMGVTVVEN